MKPTALRTSENRLSITERQMEAVYDLWDDLDRIPIGETDRALQHLAFGVNSRATLMALWLKE